MIEMLLWMLILRSYPACRFTSQINEDRGEKERRLKEEMMDYLLFCMFSELLLSLGCIGINRPRPLPVCFDRVRIFVHIPSQIVELVVLGGQAKIDAIC